VDHAEKGFGAWLISYANRVVADVKEDVNVNQFWQEVIDLFQVGVFGETPQEKRVFFRAEKTFAAHAPGAPTQSAENEAMRFCGRWESYELYINFGAVLTKMAEHLRKQGRALPLNKKDIRDQMKQHPYWIIPEGEDGHRKRFGEVSCARAWGVYLDSHPMGYQQKSDEELLAADAKRSMSENWADPRLGELYIIVKAVEKKEAELG
jgi:hypothetical protein